MRKHQLNAVRALEIVAEICEENDITFFLLAGSALGAVRHQGFIPWDDDIDIGMKLCDIYKFNEVVEKYDLEGFKISNYRCNKKHPRLFCKVIYNGEHCIDIFPIVKTSDRLIQRKSQWIFAGLIDRAYLVKIDEWIPAKPIKRAMLPVAKMLISIIPKRTIIKLAQWNEARFEHKDSSYYINLYSIYSLEQELIKAEWIDNLKYISFEKKSYLVFQNTHDYLTHLYGDYMTLPPNCDRKPSHRDLKIEFVE